MHRKEKLQRAALICGLLGYTAAVASIVACRALGLSVHDFAPWVTAIVAFTWLGAAAAVCAASLAGADRRSRDDTAAR